MNKTGYKDIIIYTVVIMLLIGLNKLNIISYNTLVIFLVLALATFTIYNLRHQLSNWISKKKS